jgi:hypothetical protein
MVLSFGQREVSAAEVFGGGLVASSLTVGDLFAAMA